MTARHRIGAFVLSFGLVIARLAGGAAAQTEMLDYKSRPLFFEAFAEKYRDEANLTLMPQGKVRLQPLGTEDITGFDWVKHTRTDESWWQRIENFIYLLPLVDSNSPSDRKLVHRWFGKWYEVHALNPNPNQGAWDSMTAAYRAMMFAYMLKREEQSDVPDPDYIKNLRRTIERHQRFLQKDENFHVDSNHGMWESLGLFETTRVLPDKAITQLALDRLITLVRTSVSSQGIHREHSPSYHFVFMDWLGDYVDYLGSLELEWGQGVRDMSWIEESMQKNSYFLFDQRGNVPQIGDTDAQTIDPALEKTLPVSDTDVLFDKEAAYAIFKDVPSSDTRRYVVFCNQNEEFRPVLRHHFHNDMMAVYYSDDGEVLLGDQGRYTYSRTDARSYLMSMAAHNTVLPASMIVPRVPGIFVAKDVWMSEDSSRVAFGASLVDKVVTREVEVPRGATGVKVTDTINNPDTFLLLWSLGTDVAGYKQGKVVKYAEWRTYEWELRTKRNRKFTLLVRIDGHNKSASDELEIVKGQEQPMLGWRSPTYNEFEPTPVIKLTLTPEERDETILRVTTTVEPAK